MRTPEEVAREIRRLTWDALGNDGLVEEDGPALADLIRARDAEVRAETLAHLDRAAPKPPSHNIVVNHTPEPPRVVYVPVPGHPRDRDRYR